MCGEQGWLAGHLMVKCGSPPRVRGTVKEVVQDKELVGITPACAGNRALFGRVGREDEDHPRVCGEQCTQSPTKAQARGSPPRVRGTAVSLALSISPSRITPACAGNRLTIWPGGEYVQDHPRVCGEQPRKPTWFDG